MSEVCRRQTESNGRGAGTRTRDLVNPNHARYQLRYTPIERPGRSIRTQVISVYSRTIYRTLYTKVIVTEISFWPTSTAGAGTASVLPPIPKAASRA